MAQTDKVEGKRNGKWIVAGIACLTIVPVVAAMASYFIWKPSGGQSYGELLHTKPVVDMRLLDERGQVAGLDAFRGKWLLLVLAPSGCEQSCRDRLFASRQFRLAQGQDMERIRRVWIVSDGTWPQKDALRAAEGADVRVLASDVALDGDTASAMYLIDPLGNQVMRYADDANRQKVIKEIGKLLKNNERLG
ncbi:cytochrome C oxidase subunit I [Burkholderiaceae bacterium DAT-1]|nr:cytochrome C oxidase subunit I [Burkholderiaceae bacterium DAT-1]